MDFLTDIHVHWFYERGDGVEPVIGRQVITLLNLDIVKGKGRPKGAPGKRKKVMLFLALG